MTSDVPAPALLVYIPTYNRPDSLRRQLSVLIAQRSEWPGTVRILVSDNASPAISDAELASIGSEFGVEVRRNAANIGANANIALGFVFVRPDEHLWILSDNDTLGPAALRSIVTDGLSPDADAIIFSTRTRAPSSFVHQWSTAWDGVHETGLISNVIYRSSTFLPQAAQAFLYHNTSFPHLCVLLATLKERGSLRYAVLPRSRVFAPDRPHGEQPGDYLLSLSGMPQLLPLLPAPQARKFARLWLRNHGSEFFEHRDAYPGVHVSSAACLRRYGGLRARARLSALGVRHALFGGLIPPATRFARRHLPEGLKRLLRRDRG